MDGRLDGVVVEVADLTKRFGALEAVRGVSFQVRQGEVFGIVGPNGAGKTTTLEIIEGLQPATSGTARVLGLDVRHATRDVKERIGVQLQASAYPDFLTLHEILDIFGSFYRRRLQPDDLLARVELLDKRDVQVRQLSGGQKQRFSIVAAMVNDPEVVFLDEPTTGLDPQARRSLWELVRQIRAGGRTVILTTHYMEEAETLCDRVAIMDLGYIVALDTPAALVRSLPRASVIRLRSREALPWLGEAGATMAAAGDDGYLYEVPSDRPVAALRGLLARVDGGDEGVLDIQVVPATLEDVFLALTGRHLEE